MLYFRQLQRPQVESRWCAAVVRIQPVQPTPGRPAVGHILPVVPAGPLLRRHAAPAAPEPPPGARPPLAQDRVPVSPDDALASSRVGWTLARPPAVDFVPSHRPP